MYKAGDTILIAKHANELEASIIKIQGYSEKNGTAIKNKEKKINNN